MTSYYRFWLRTCSVMCPLIFFVLYASGVAMKWVLLSTAITALVGLLLVLPFILIFGNADRSLWSREEQIQRRLRYQEKLRAYERGDDEEETEEV